MDPLTLGIGAIGVGLQLAGGIGGVSAAHQAAGIQQKITGLETQANDQRRQAMELSARRQQLEIFRNTQRARASGLNASVNQGAQFGSGKAGGQAQATDQGLFNIAGVNQNLGIGRNLFSINNDISQQKMQLSAVQGDMATYQGLSNLGGAITKGAGTISNIAGNFQGGVDLSGIGFNPIKGVAG